MMTCVGDFSHWAKVKILAGSVSPDPQVPEFGFDGRRDHLTWAPFLIRRRVSGAQVSTPYRSYRGPEPAIRKDDRLMADASSARAARPKSICCPPTFLRGVY